MSRARYFHSLFGYDVDCIGVGLVDWLLGKSDNICPWWMFLHLESWSMPGHHNLDLRRCLQRIILAWSWWAIVIALVRNAFGSTFLFPRRTMLLATHSSLAMLWKDSLYVVRVSAIHFRTRCSSGSVTEAELISSVSIALGDMCSAKKLTYQSAVFTLWL